MATEPLENAEERGEISGSPRPRVLKPKPKALQQPPKATISVIETIHFQSPDTEPRTVTSRFSREVRSDEQPYVRELKVTDQWAKLDCGWFADKVMEIGFLYLKSKDGTFHGGQPTDEQRAYEARKFIEIGMVPPERSGPPRDMHSPPKPTDPEPIVIAIFPPGESQRLCLPCVNQLRIRCGAGVAKVTLTVFPR